MNPNALTQIIVSLALVDTNVTVTVELTHAATLYEVLAVACEVAGVTPADVLHYSIINHTWERG